MKWKITCILVQGRFFSGSVHTIPDSCCAGTKPYRIGLLFTHKNSDWGAISVTERSCATPISKVGSHISDRCWHYTGELLRRPKRYRIGLLFTHKNRDFGAISVTEGNCATPISKVESHISDRCSYYIGDLFVSAQQSIRYHVKIAWKACPAIRCKLNVIIPICESAWITK